MSSSTNDTSTITAETAESSTTRLVKYIFLQTFQIPARLCSLFIFYCVCRERELRRLHNHTMLLILISCFLILIGELPITLSFLRSGSLTPQSDQLCLYWIFVNYTLEGINTVLMAFASIERFVLIFYATVITGSQRRKLWFHYIPMIFCCVIVIIWYSVLVLLYPCVNTFDYNFFLCNSACYQANVLIGTIDWIGSVLLPVIIVIVFNVSLLIRVILQKRRLHVPLNWRRTRKMTIQLLAIVVVFLDTQVPLTIFVVIRLTLDPKFLNTVLTLWYYSTPYLIFLITPFLFVITTKEVSKYLIVRNPHRVNAVSPHTVRHPKNAETII
jgi:hypothetical protein